MNDYLGQDALDVTLSPGRVTYLFPAGSRQHFRRAVQEASSRWCGATEPIVPVRRGGKVDVGWSEVAEQARTFRAVNVGCPDEDAAKAANALGLGLTPLSRIDHDAATQAIHWSFIKSTVSTPVAARADSDLWEAVVAGDPQDPTDGEAPLRGPVRLPSDDGAGRAGLFGNTVLDAGLSGYTYNRVSNGKNGPTTIWLTKPNSLLDCVWFWNMRALQGHGMLTAPIYLLPEHALDHWIDVRLVLEGLLRRPYSGRPSVVFLSRTVDQEVLMELARSLGLKRQAEGRLTFPLFEGASTELKAETYMLDVDPRIWMMSDKVGGYHESVRVQLFREGTPVKAVPQVATEVLPRGFFFRSQVLFSGGYLDSLPKIDGIATLVHPNATWRHRRLNLILGIHAGAEVALSCPTESAVLEAVAASPSASIATSDKGYLASALMRSRDCSVITNVDASRAISALATPRSGELLRTLESAEPGSHQRMLVEIAQEWGGRAERRTRSAAELGPRRRITEVMEALANGGWAERGIRLKCVACLMSSFLPLRSVGQAFECPGCGSSAIAQGDNGPVIHYRLNSLVDRCSDQGAIPHVVAAQALKALGRPCAFLLGANISWDGGGTAEVDIFGYVGAEVVAGEVKTSSLSFTDDQIDRDIELSRRLGADRHVMASMERLSESTIAYARDRAAESELNLSVIAPVGDGIVVDTPF